MFPVDEGKVCCRIALTIALVEFKCWFALPKTAIAEDTEPALGNCAAQSRISSSAIRVKFCPPTHPIDFRMNVERSLRARQYHACPWFGLLCWGSLDLVLKVVFLLKLEGIIAAGCCTHQRSSWSGFELVRARPLSENPRGLAARGCNPWLSPGGGRCEERCAFPAFSVFDTFGLRKLILLSMD